MFFIRYKSCPHSFSSEKQNDTKGDGVLSQIDIACLYRFLMEHQELDPEIARRILQKILDILQEIQRVRVNEHPDITTESVDKGQ